MFCVLGRKDDTKILTIFFLSAIEALVMILDLSILLTNVSANNNESAY